MRLATYLDLVKYLDGLNPKNYWITDNARHFWFGDVGITIDRSAGTWQSFGKSSTSRIFVGMKFDEAVAEVNKAMEER